MTTYPCPPRLTAGSVVLRQWVTGDAGAVLAALRDPQIALWNAAPAGTLAAAEEWIRQRIDSSAGDHVSLAIADAEDGRLLGSVSLHRIDLEQGDAEIGYWVVPSARGRGLAATAVGLLCRWAFRSLPLDRIELAHAVQNEASARVAAKAGFTHEGRLRQSYRYGDGVKHDEFLWSLLRSDLPE